MPSDTIPVWSRSLGSWRFSIARHPFAASELEGHYDKASGAWQTTLAKLGFEQAYDNLLERVWSHIPDLSRQQPLHVLDAGIGTGAMAAAFAKRYRGAVDLAGVDVSSAMLRHAEANLRQLDMQVQLTQGDLNALPFADGSFDVILVAHVLEHMADPEAALTELYRVLKPGGLMIACVTRRSSAGIYIQLKWRTHRVASQTALGWFRRAGLQNVQAVALDQRSAAHRFSTGYFGRKLRL